MRLPMLQPATRPDTGPRSIGAVRMLRVSVTDRCNFRCTYCMPAGGVAWLGKHSILSFEEIAAVVRAAVEVHGITRFKLTGGEPTVRHGLTDLVAMLGRINGVSELSMTTNGFKLVDLAGPLKESGLDRVTVSLDSLRPDRFKAITRTGDLTAVLNGLDRLDDVGFTATKINCVAMKGVNDDEFGDFAKLAVDHPWTVRFIEYMPLGDSQIQARPGAPDPTGVLTLVRHETASGSRVDPSETGPTGGCGAQDRGDAFVDETTIRRSVEQAVGPLTAVDRETESGVGPATVYRPTHGRGRVGFISAMSAPFCSTCNRLRLTADGVLRSCLFEGGEVDVRSILRAGGDQPALARAMTDCVRLKPDVHSGHGNQQMSRIGG